SWVQMVSGTQPDTASTVSATWSLATTQGNLLVAIISYEDGTGIAITPPAGGWTLAKRQDNTTKVGTAIYYIANANSQSGASTWSLSPADKAVLVLAEYSGIQRTSPLDVTASSSGASTSLNSGTTAI